MPLTGFNQEDEEKQSDLFKSEPLVNRMLNSRLVLVNGPINQELAEKTMAQLLVLDTTSNDPIRVIVTSPGGHVDAGFAIYDTMKMLDSTVITIGAGWVASIAVPIFFGGEKGKRYSLPHARYLLHQPSGGAGGQAADIRIEAQQSSDGQPFAFLALDGVEVAEEAVLGGVAGGAERLEWLIDRATVARCAIQLGVTERALEQTAAYGRERVQFDRPIGSFQAYHQRLADAYIEIEGIRLTTWEAIWKLSRGLDARDAVHVAKFAAAEGGALAAYACQHLHGGVGIDVDYPLHRYFKWATQIEHELGSAKLQLVALGDRIASGEVATF